MSEYNPEELNTENKSSENEPYNLYTEHIVKSPGQRAKKVLKRILLLLVMAIGFGLIAGLIMIIVYRTGNRMLDGNQPVKPPVETSREETTASVVTESESPTASAPIQTQAQSQGDAQTQSHGDVTITLKETESESEAPTEVETETSPTETESDDTADIVKQYMTLKQVASQVNRSMVTVRVSTEIVDWFSATYQNVTEEYGLVVANKESGCYILTEYDLVKGAKEILVSFDDEVYEATVMGQDATTGLAVIMTQPLPKDQITEAKLADVDSLEQGDFLLAVGKLYGFAGSVGYGIATSTTNVVSDTDSCYQLINTDIQGTENSAGVLANLRGEIVGIITTQYHSGNNSLITGYAVSGMLQRIENMSNAYETAYFGIRGQDVTETIQEKNGLPAGIYIAAVESNSPAYLAGIQTGDIMTGIEGEPITSMAQFMELLASHQPKDTITVTMERKGRDAYKTIEFSVVLAVE